MKKILKISIPLLILAALIYQFRARLTSEFLPLWDNLSVILFKKVPCEEPIPYNLGTFSTEFNISKSYFLSALAEAETIWEKSAGRELFTYTPTDTGRDVVKVNLIYDYRQQATSKLASLGIVVKDNRASYDALKAKFTTLKVQYEKEKNIYNAQITTFNQKKAAYEAEVKSWNKKGGAPEAEYNKLEAERAELDSDFKKIQAAQTNINNMADEINALVVALNRLVVILNLSVDKYNTTSTARGESFEEGVYSSDGITSEIDVYEFSSRQKLLRVLTHELGHALGLEHVEDPKAIMYKLNQGNNETLTKADIDALNIKCGLK